MKLMNLNEKGQFGLIGDAYLLKSKSISWVNCMEDVMLKSGFMLGNGCTMKSELCSLFFGHVSDHTQGAAGHAGLGCVGHSSWTHRE